jgi:hypothetical protein
MSKQQYVEDCVGCRPVAVDLQTGQPCGEDHPLSRALARVWGQMGPLHKAAFHRVTCLSSRNPLDLALAKEYITRVKAAALKEKGNGTLPDPPLQPGGDDGKPDGKPVLH